MYVDVERWTSENEEKHPPCRLPFSLVNCGRFRQKSVTVYLDLLVTGVRGRETS